MSAWKEMMICEKCDYIVEITLDDICPKCGDIKQWFEDDKYFYHYGWKNVIAKKISNSIWYKPWTWGKSHYEIKPYKI